MLESRECYGCGETGHIRRNCPKQSYRPPIARGRGGYGRGRYSGERGGRGNGGHQNGRGDGQTGATTSQHGRGNGQTKKGPIVTLSLGGQKRRHQMLSSQVIFRFVIAWLLYCLILDPHFLMYLLHLLMV